MIRLVAAGASNGEKDPPAKKIEMAEAVLQFLNSKTGKRFPARNPRGQPTANAMLIYHRIEDGYTVEDMRSVIALKCRAWGHDDKMRQYLRPSTLFRLSNFEQYIGELDIRELDK